MTYEMKVLTCTGMVQVNGYGIFLDFDDGGIESATILTHHGHNSTLVNIVEVYLPIHHEDGFRHVEHQFLVELTIGISTRDDEVELIATSEVTHVILELGKHQVESTDELERMTLICHLNRLCVFLTILNGVKLICKGDILVVYFHKE